MYRNRMVLLTVMCTLLPTISSCQHSQPAPQSTPVTFAMQTMGLNGQEQFVEVTLTTGLPPAVKAWFPGGLADPGDKYRDTDVGDSHLPSRRLLVAGVSPKYCIVNYERGGWAYGQVMILFSLEGKVTPLWTGNSEKLEHLADLKAAIESGRVKHEPGIAW